MVEARLRIAGTGGEDRPQNRPPQPLYYRLGYIDFKTQLDRLAEASVYSAIFAEIATSPFGKVRRHSTPMLRPGVRSK